MQVIFVDKKEVEVAKKCGRKNQLIKKYSKIDDLTYSLIEGSDSQTNGQVYYGSKVQLDRLSLTDGYIVYVPEHGKLFFELVKIDEDFNKISFKSTRKALKIPENALITISRRDKFECNPANNRVENLDTYAIFFAVYSISDGQIDEETRTVNSQPKFEKIDFLDESSKFSYCLVFNSNDDENHDFFCDKLTEEVFDGLNFKEYTIADSQRKFFISKPLKVDEILSFSENQNLSVLELTVLRINATRVLPNRQELSVAMKSEFVRADRIFSPFLNYVLNAASCEGSETLARLFHLAQSSGTGKTKLCLNLLKELKCGIYSVHRSDDSSEFPDKTSWTENLIDDFKNTKTDEDAVDLCLDFICAALKTFSSYNDIDPIELYSDLRQESFLNFAEKFNTSFLEAKSKNTENKISLIYDLTSNIEVGCFPIIIDECHEFLCYPDESNRISLYRAFRMAMILIKSTKVVAICLGTKSSLNDFVLNYRVDPSSRPGDNLKPISPYIFVHSFDVFLSGEIKLFHANLIEKRIEGTSFFNPETLKQVAIKCGRPLWNAYGEYTRALNGATIKFAADEKIARMSAFVLRTGAPVVPSCELSHELVLSGMALLEYVDVYGEKCEVSYCPEPILSSAARLFAGSLENLSIVLKQFLEYIDKICVLDLGSSGEFVARIAILLPLISWLKSLRIKYGLLVILSNQ